MHTDQLPAGESLEHLFALSAGRLRLRPIYTHIYIYINIYINININIYICRRYIYI